MTFIKVLLTGYSPAVNYLDLDIGETRAYMNLGIYQIFVKDSNELKILQTGS